MQFDKPLLKWRFNRREKRFFIYGAEDGQVAHCPNTGSMKGLLEAEYVWVSDHGDGPRKLRYTAEMLEMPGGVLVGINTQRPNRLAMEAIGAGLVDGLKGNIKHEVKYDAATRFDLRVGEVWVEVKNVTLAENGVAAFPDSRTERGEKHVRELQNIVSNGGQAMQLYVVQRADCVSVRPAEEIDPAYAAALRRAVAGGVKVAAIGCTLGPMGITVDKLLPVVL